MKTAIHFIDLAAVNSWMEYRQTAKESEVEKKNIMDLMNYRLALGESLTASPTTKRYLEEDPETQLPEPPIKKPACSPLPCNDKKLDGFDHWPIMDDLSTARNCRVKDCKSHTRVSCTKCNVYLCLSTKNNCFTEFHKK